MENMTSVPMPESTSAALPTLKSFRTLFREAWDFYKMHARKIVSLLGIPLLATVGLVFVIALFIPSEDPKLLENITSSLSSVVMGIATLALLFLIVTPEIGGTEAFKRAMKGLLSYALIGLLEGFLILGGIFCFVIPGVYLAMLFTFSHFAFIAEGKRGWEALQTSARYVKGDAWHVFGLTFGFAIVTLFLYLIVALPLGYLVVALGGQPAASFINTLVQTLFINPLSILFSYRLYVNLREYKNAKNAQAAFENRAVVGVAIAGYVIATVLAVLFGPKVLENFDTAAALKRGAGSSIEETLVPEGESGI